MKHLVHIAKDVPGELILERLTIDDCVKVFCTEEQETAVCAVSRDVASIGGDESMKDEVTGALHLNPNFKVINASDYVM